MYFADSFLTDFILFFYIDHNYLQDLRLWQSVLEYYAILINGWLSICQRHLFETSVAVYQLTCHNIPEGFECLSELEGCLVIYQY